jgi:hypothetical protein
MAALMRITTAIATASTHSPKANDRAAATTRSRTIRLLNCSARICQVLLLSVSRRRFGPKRLRRALTSEVSSPVSAETSRASRISCQECVQGVFARSFEKVSLI